MSLCVCMLYVCVTIGVFTLPVVYHLKNENLVSPEWYEVGTFKQSKSINQLVIF